MKVEIDKQYIVNLKGERHPGLKDGAIVEILAKIGNGTYRVKLISDNEEDLHHFSTSYCDFIYDKHLIEKNSAQLEFSF